MNRFEAMLFATMLRGLLHVLDLCCTENPELRGSVTKKGAEHTVCSFFNTAGKAMCQLNAILCHGVCVCVWRGWDRRGEGPLVQSLHRAFPGFQQCSPKGKVEL